MYTLKKNHPLIVCLRKKYLTWVLKSKPKRRLGVKGQINTY